VSFQEMLRRLARTSRFTDASAIMLMALAERSGHDCED
jgi:hypothetical protein